MNSKIQAISSFLTERKERLKPEEANELNLKRIEKIDFSGQIHLVENKPTKTGMIVIKKGDLVISGINVAKGALAVYEGDEDVIATIHYSSYSFDKEKIDINFLKWFLKSPAFIDALKKQTGGGIKTEIKAKKFLSLKVPIPILDEQKKIESNLNKFEEKYNQISKELQRQFVLIKKLRESILKDLLEMQKSNWNKTILIEVIESKPRNGLSIKAVDYKTNVKSLTLSATSSGKFKPEHSKYLDIDIEKDSHLWLENGDILIQRANSSEYVGIAAIYDGENQEFIYPDLMMKIKAKKDIVNIKFLQLLLISPSSREYFVNNSVGTSSSMKKINQETVSNLPIFYPSLEEQKRIVEKVEKLMATCDALELEVQNSKIETEKLMQSVLKEAFI